MVKYHLLFLFMSLIIFCGVRFKYITSFLFLLLLLSPLFWSFLRDYQKDRLLVFLNANRDPLGAGYTIIQSKIAIGSGRLFGKGWLSGTQNQLNFLTEPSRKQNRIFLIFLSPKKLLSGRPWAWLLPRELRSGSGPGLYFCFWISF